jgi:O-acetyl-ADP-ribose deacetylase (regulator of RNase III)
MSDYNFNIELKQDFAINQDVDLVFNSASGLLFMRTGTAEAIRNNSKFLFSEESQEYINLLAGFRDPVMKAYVKKFSVDGWTPSQAQLSCFRKIDENGGPYEVGSLILDDQWSNNSKDILHVVGMTYYLKNNELKTTKVSEKSLISVLKKAFKFADAKGYKTIATPVLCTRGDYGLDPEKSLNSILKAVELAKPVNLTELYICFESEGPRATFEKLEDEVLDQFF